MSAEDQRQTTRWRRLSELPAGAFAAWRKPDRAVSPVAIVATVDPDGAPHAAPFGSLRAVTPGLLRLITWRGHDTYKNLCRDDRVTVAMLAPPDLALTVRGRARVVREQMASDEQYAIVEIDVEEVKNDMGRAFSIETALTVSILERHQPWFDAALGEAEEMQ